MNKNLLLAMILVAFATGGMLSLCILRMLSDTPWRLHAIISVIGLIILAIYLPIIWR